MNKNKNKLVLLFLSLFVIGGGGCYSLFYSRNKEFFKEEKKPDILEIAKKDILLLCQQLDDYEQKVSDEKRVRQEDLEKSIEILKDQGLWDNEIFFSRDYKEFLDTVQSAIKAFQLQLDELLKKVEKEKNLESFREELAKIGEEHKKRIDLFTNLAEKIRKEAQPMPFFATWIGLVISAAICSLISFFILNIYKGQIFIPNSLNKRKKNLDPNFQKRERQGKKTEGQPAIRLTEEDFKEIKGDSEEIKGNCFEDWIEDKYIMGIMGFLFVIHLPLQFLIFPLINCLLSLKISTFRETNKHYIINYSKFFFLCFSFIVVDFLFAHKLCYGVFFGCHCPKPEPEEHQPKTGDLNDPTTDKNEQK